ncbi:kirola-like [Rutidosis leptorrhynchoides]|uniref:kirola-like n=1 Tax=Rutidosis leptorrhynchoides TaxID=125765 RepID=UPI003A99C74F
MALSGKLVAQIEIKSNGDVFHELWKANPHDVPKLTPTTIQKCETHSGEAGTVGSVLFWNYFHDGKDSVAKTLLHDIDEEKKSVTFKILEGDLLELYKNFIIHIHVDTNGLNNLVTWTVEYEKLNANVPDPNTLLDFYRKVTKDIETHHVSTASN